MALRHTCTAGTALDWAMTKGPARWVRGASGRAHLDLGERSTESLRVQADRVIVTACRAHLAEAAAEVVADTFAPKCSNCVRFARTLTPQL